MATVLHMWLWNVKRYSMKKCVQYYKEKLTVGVRGWNRVITALFCSWQCFILWTKGVGNRLEKKTVMQLRSCVTLKYDSKTSEVKHSRIKRRFNQCFDGQRGWTWLKQVKTLPFSPVKPKKFWRIYQRASPSKVRVEGGWSWKALVPGKGAKSLVSVPLSVFASNFIKFDRSVTKWSSLLDIVCGEFHAV